MNLKQLTAVFSQQYRLRWLASIALLFTVDIANYMAFSQSGGPQVVNNQDKILHALAFFVLFVMGHISIHFDFLPHTKRRVVPLVFNALVWLGYGLFIELVQHFISYRSSSVGDVLADAFGIVLGIIFVTMAQLYPRRSSSNG